MFRTSKCPSSGRTVHAGFCYLFHAAIYAVWSMAGCAFCWLLLHRYFSVIFKFTACLISKNVSCAFPKDYYIYV